jgi:hypothetical protein
MAGRKKSQNTQNKVQSLSCASCGEVKNRKSFIKAIIQFILPI